MTKAEQLRLIIENQTGVEVGYYKSETDWGVSEYLTWWYGEKLFKVRISDHAATNKVRLEKEIMFYDSETVERMFYTIEQIMFPERFEFRECQKGERPTHIKNGKHLIIIRK